MSDQCLQDITVAVTGAAGGLGKVIAQSFLESGSRVAICDVHDERLKQTEEEWSKYGDKVLVSKTDITDEAAVEAFVQQITEKLGGLDILVNNAGTMDSFDPVGTTSKAVWDRVLDINLTGTFLCTKAAVNTMLATRKGGTIISIGSNASFRGFQSGAAYTTSKHALLGLVRNTAGFYGSQGVYSISLLLGAMEGTNVADSFRTMGMNMESLQKISDVNPGYVMKESKMELSDVAKYCIFLADRKVAQSSNGGSITVNKNYPMA